MAERKLAPAACGQRSGQCGITQTPAKELQKFAATLQSVEEFAEIDCGRFAHPVFLTSPGMIFPAHTGRRGFRQAPANHRGGEILKTGK
jgi:hypothetical protein